MTFNATIPIDVTEINRKPRVPPSDGPTMPASSAFIKSLLQPSVAESQNRCENCLKELGTAQGLTAHYATVAECHAGRIKKHREQLIKDSLVAGGFPAFDGTSDGEGEESLSDVEAQRPRKRTRTTVEDDPEDNDKNIPIETVIEEHPHGAKTFGVGTLEFEARRAQQKANKEPSCAPFASFDQYEFCQWMMGAVPSLAEVDKGLKLNLVRTLW